MKKRYIIIDGPFSGGLSPAGETPVWYLTVLDEHENELEEYGSVHYSTASLYKEAERLEKMFRRQKINAEIINEGVMEP